MKKIKYPTKGKRATLTMTIIGAVGRWGKGTAVWARKTGPGEYFISRVRTVGKGNLPILNKMAGVPSYLVRIKRKCPTTPA